MPEDALITVIIPTFNNRVQVELCLRSMRSCTRRAYRVIVKDNGSTDGTVEFLHATGLADLVLRSTANDIDNIESKAYDATIRDHVTTPFFLVCHSDIVFLEPDWVEDVLAAAGEDEANVLGGSIFPSSFTGHWILGRWLSPWYAWGRTEAFRRLDLTWRRRFPDWCAPRLSEFSAYFDEALIAAHPEAPLFWEHGGFLTAQVERHGARIVDRQPKAFHIGDMTGSVVKATLYPDEPDVPHRLARSRAIRRIIVDTLAASYGDGADFRQACRNIAAFALDQDLPQLRHFRT